MNSLQVTEFPSTPALRGRLLVMDRDGDLIPDYLGSSDNNVATFWTQASSIPTFNPLSNVQLHPFDVQSFADLNGDCLADLILVTLEDSKRNLEIWNSSRSSDG